MLAAQLGGQHVGDPGDEVERGLHDPDEVPHVEPVGERVDRQQPRQRGGLAVLAEHQVVRLLELPGAVEELGLAGEEAPAAGAHLGDVLLGLAGVGAEERQREVGSVGADPDLGAVLLLAAGEEVGHPRRGHLADDRQQLAHDRLGDLGQLGGHDVAPRAGGGGARPPCGCRGPPRRACAWRGCGRRPPPPASPG